MSVQVRFDISVGWADCHLDIDGSAVTVTASYLTDGVGDLVASVASLLRGAPESVVVFAGEPGEYRWQLARADRGRVRVQISATQGLAADPALGVVSVLDAECRLRTFAGQLAAEMDRLAGAYGTDGYEAAWGHRFPQERLDEIRRSLRTRATHTSSC